MTQTHSLLLAITLALAGAAPAMADSGRGHDYGRHEYSSWHDGDGPGRGHKRGHRHSKHRHHHELHHDRVVVREVPVYLPPPVIERPRAVIISTPDIVIPF